MNLRIEAMPTAEAERIRHTMRDEYGNALTSTVDTDGGAPCRYCLRDAKPGEKVVLLSYRPFSRSHEYQEVGPIFIHAAACERYDAANDPPDDLLKRTLVLRPYDHRDRIQDSQQTAGPGKALSVAAGLLENPQVAYVHARSATRGCYMFRIERGELHAQLNRSA